MSNDTPDITSFVASIVASPAQPRPGSGSGSGSASGPRRAPARIVLAEQPPRFQGMVATWQQLLAEPFVGITCDGEPQPGLYTLSDADTASCADAVSAADALLAALDDDQRRAARFPIDDRAWRAWSNIHRNVMRHGACLDGMSDAQRARVLDLVAACVAPRTHGEIVATMRLNEHLAELTGKPGEYGEWFYYLSLFGTHSLTEPWGWQLDGHHVNINCFMRGGQMVLTPMLLGAEPVRADSGRYAGTAILREEEARGWQFMNALSPEQQDIARLGLELPFDGLGSGFKDNLCLTYQGIAWDTLEAGHREMLTGLIALYVDRLPAAHAVRKMDEIAAHLDRTHFAWMGPCDATSPFYYRVHAPTIYIEFFHQPGIALPNNGFTRLHAHALVRTPNGNDYGRVLLREHRARSGATASASDAF